MAPCIIVHYDAATVCYRPPFSESNGGRAPPSGPRAGELPRRSVRLDGRCCWPRHLRRTSASILPSSAGVFFFEPTTIPYMCTPPTLAPLCDVISAGARMCRCTRGRRTDARVSACARGRARENDEVCVWERCPEIRDLWTGLLSAA
jgi:hypothetical protein